MWRSSSSSSCLDFCDCRYNLSIYTYIIVLCCIRQSQSDAKPLFWSMYHSDLSSLTEFSSELTAGGRARLRSWWPAFSSAPSALVLRNSETKKKTKSNLLRGVINQQTKGGLSILFQYNRCRNPPLTPSVGLLSKFSKFEIYLQVPVYKLVFVPIKLYKLCRNYPFPPPLGGWFSNFSKIEIYLQLVRDRAHIT